ncbi:hypothetical protein F5B20DRAFT_579874 [Whalleya microplaca]|nr:hypothetical protein F5B20DRAFT_579874 [Whalleya microplaca]
MPPFLFKRLTTPLDLLMPRDAKATVGAPAGVSDILRAQWGNPSDVLSVLLLLGPDTVQRAVAQLAGRVVVPVAFSFGWVAYASSALLKTFGDGRLMPDADMANTCVIGARGVDYNLGGHSRNTNNWVLGRLLRDENDRVDADMRHEQAHVPPAATEEIHQAPPPSYFETKSKAPQWEALRVTVYDVDDNPPQPHGVPTLDLVWYSGVTVVIIQLAVSIIPWAVNDDWGTFLITAAGNVLSLISASLPKWRDEKWSCPKPPKGGATITITQGNGSRHAIVILGKRGVGLDLEILALGTRTATPDLLTKIMSGVLAFMWIVLLITVAGLEGNSWYLLGVGLLGSIQNLYAAGAPRKPSAFSIHLKYRETIHNTLVAAVLKEVEDKYPTVGTSLVSVFFPGALRVKGDDLVFWRRAFAAKKAPNKYGTRIDYDDGAIAAELERKQQLSDEIREVEVTEMPGNTKG